MSRKPASKHKIQADSIREFVVALEDEASRLYDKGYRNYETGKDWLKPGIVLNWIVAGFLSMDPDERERFAAIRGRAEFDRLLASGGPRYYRIQGEDHEGPPGSEAGTEGTIDSAGDATRDVAPRSPGRKKGTVRG